jgi:hypothetical protein
MILFHQTLQFQKNMSPSQPPAIMPNIMPNEDDILLGLPWDTLNHSHPGIFFLKRVIELPILSQPRYRQSSKSTMFLRNLASKGQPYSWQKEEFGDAID